MENSKIGTEITIIQAADSDSGDYGKITYLLDRMSSQVENANDTNFFVIMYKHKNFYNNSTFNFIRTKCCNIIIMRQFT